MPESSAGVRRVLPFKDRIVEFCIRWSVAEFAVFGSILTDHFGSESDVDVLLSFRESATWSLLDLVTMQDELEQTFGRPVDLIEEAALRNPNRRRRILSTKRVIYAA